MISAAQTPATITDEFHRLLAMRASTAKRNRDKSPGVPQEKSETLLRITSEVGAMLISENVTKRELEDASFNRAPTTRLVTEKVQSDALLIELDALLEQAVFEQTELSESLRDSIQGYGISVTTSDLGLPGSLLF